MIWLVSLFLHFGYTPINVSNRHRVFIFIYCIKYISKSENGNIGKYIFGKVIFLTYKLRFCFFNTNKKRNILWSFLKWWQQNTQDLHIGNLSNLWTKVNKKVSDFRNWVVAQNTLYWYELLYQPLETFRNKIDQFVLFWRTYFEESRKYFKVYIHHIQMLLNISDITVKSNFHLI